MVAQVIAIFLLLLGRRFALLRLPGLVMIWVVVVLAVVSGVDYFRIFFREVYRNAPRPEPAPPGEPFRAPVAKAPLE